MKIGIDLRPLQTQQSRNRGIGNYVHHQVLALLRIAVPHDLFLFYAENWPQPDLLTLAPPGRHWTAVPLTGVMTTSDAPGASLSLDVDFHRASAFQAAMAQYNLDLFHITSPFEWEIALGHSFRVCPTIATLYDLIPLVFAPIYLCPAGEEFREKYIQRLRLLASMRRLLAISDAARQDVVKWLGFPKPQVDVIYAGADQSFVPLETPAPLMAVRQKFSLAGDYVLSVLGFHHTKNIEGAIAAYSHVDAALRAHTPLVIVCRLSVEERRVVQTWAQKYAVESQVLLTGEIAKSELIALYNGATVFFYPSRYDGFGLPVLEAMQCGTPVVTSTASSLPEVAGDAALLADPEDHQALARHLQLLLTDGQTRQGLRAKGLLQAQRFSWDAVAQATLRGYQQAVASDSMPVIHAPPRRRVAYWSPLNPTKSGISDYSEHLLPHLAHYADFDLYVDGVVPANDKMAQEFAIYDYHAFPVPAVSRKYDTSLYQMGNSIFHEYLYRQLLAEPGVVVLHDYILQGFFYGMTEMHGDRERYLAEIAYAEGPEASTAVAQGFAAGKLMDAYQYPMNRRIVEASRGLIVHSQWAKAQLEARGVEKPVAVIPHGVRLLVTYPERKRWLRLQFNIAPETLVVASFGRIIGTKRIVELVRAFAHFRMLFPESLLLLVGAPDAPTASFLQEARGRYGLGDSLRVTGYIPETHFDAYLRISDVCVNLRYPSAGETSGTLCRALAAGVPVLTSALPQFLEYPEDCVWKVDIGGAEERQLTAYLSALATDAELRQQMGQNALRYSEEYAVWPVVASQYMQFIERVIS